MATLYVGPVTANQTVTQNVDPGDTVVVTVQGPGPFDGASSTTQINIGTVTKTGSREYTLSNFTAGTTYTFSTGDDDGDPYTVTGTVSSAITAPTISGTTFLYYNNQPGAVFISGSTYFVQTRINLSSNGGGGTLEYGRNTSSDNVSGASWQTSNTFNHLLGGVRYFYASQNRAASGSFDSTGGVLYNYIAPANASVNSTTVDFGATSKVVNISGTTEDFGGYLNRAAEAYSISLTDFGNGEISASTVSADRIGVVNSLSNEPDVNFTIPNGSLPANTAGATETYYVYAYRRADWSGKQVYIKTDSFTLTRAAPPITAPTASSVTFDNPASPNTTATVNLSASGSGGTLQYACEINDTTPDNWQSSNQFTISRGSSGTVYARARRSTTAVSNTVSASRPGFLDPDTDIADINNQNFVNGAASSFIVSISGGTSNTVYQVRETSNSGTVLASRTGDGNITVNDIPANNSTKTYYVTAYRTTASGGGGSGVVSAVQTFTVTVGTVTSSGGAGTSTGTDSYGLSVFGPDGTTVVWGTNNRQTNLEVNDTTTYTSTGTTSKTFTVANANDATKVIVAVGVPNPTTGPLTQVAASGVTVTKTSTGFTVSVSFTSFVTSLTVRALAARIA